MNHRGKNGRNHEYQDSNDSASTPERGDRSREIIAGSKRVESDRKWESCSYCNVVTWRCKVRTILSEEQLGHSHFQK